VKKQADPPMKFDMGSAKKTPVEPSPYNWGNIMVKGITIMAFLSKEKKTACFDFPKATKTHWPANCKDIIKKPKKYIRRELRPASIILGSRLNI